MYDEKMGDLLNEFSASVFTVENKNQLPSVKQIFEGYDSERLCNFTITPDVVRSKLLKLKMNKAPGVDCVSTRMLLELVDEISDPLSNLFTISLTTGDVPTRWKLANVSAIFKKGKKFLPSNYRPISLTVHICEVFE